MPSKKEKDIQSYVVTSPLPDVSKDEIVAYYYSVDAYATAERFNALTTHELEQLTADCRQNKRRVKSIGLKNNHIFLYIRLVSSALCLSPSDIHSLSYVCVYTLFVLIIIAVFGVQMATAAAITDAKVKGIWDSDARCVCGSNVMCPIRVKSVYYCSSDCSWHALQTTCDKGEEVKVDVYNAKQDRIVTTAGVPVFDD